MGLAVRKPLGAANEDATFNGERCLRGSSENSILFSSWHVACKASSAALAGESSFLRSVKLATSWQLDPLHAHLIQRQVLHTSSAILSVVSIAENVDEKKQYVYISSVFLFCSFFLLSFSLSFSFLFLFSTVERERPVFLF